MSDGQSSLFLANTVYPHYDLGTKRERHVCKPRPSIATQLASTLWHSIQGSQMEWVCGINKPAGGNINMKDGPLLSAIGDHKQAPYVRPSPRLQPQHRCSDPPPTGLSRAFTSRSHRHTLFINPCLTPPSLCSLCPHLTLLSFFPCLLASFFSGLTPKADGPCKQMLPTQYLEGKKQQRLNQSKQNLLETSRQINGVGNPW